MILAELHRTPFDLSEAEAELTAGYQSEHGGSAFSAFFLAEYNGVLVFCVIFALIFLGGWRQVFTLDILLGFSLKIIGAIALCVFVRAALPRTRLITFLNTAWSALVPGSTNLFMLYFSIVFLLNALAALLGPSTLSKKRGLSPIIHRLAYLSSSSQKLLSQVRAIWPVREQSGKLAMSPITNWKFGRFEQHMSLAQGERAADSLNGRLGLGTMPCTTQYPDNYREIDFFFKLL